MGMDDCERPTQTMTTRSHHSFQSQASLCILTRHEFETENEKSHTNRKRAERLSVILHMKTTSADVPSAFLASPVKINEEQTYLMWCLLMCLTPLCSLGRLFVLIKLVHQVLLLFLHGHLLSLDGLPPPLLALQSIPAPRTRVSGRKPLLPRQRSGCEPQRTSPSSSAASLPGPETSSAGPRWCRGSGGVCTARGCPCTSA